MPHYEPHAAAGVPVNEIAVVAQGKAAARDSADAGVRVKLDGILFSGGIDEPQGVVLSLDDVQENLGSLGHHRVVQRECGIGARQGSVSPMPLMMAAFLRERATAMLLMVALRRRAMAMMLLVLLGWAMAVMLLVLRGRAVIVMVVPVGVAAVVLMRRRRRGRIVRMVIVAAGEQSACCKKGDGSDELLSILPCKHNIPPVVCINLFLLAVSYRRDIGGR